MAVVKRTPKSDKFNAAENLPFSLRLEDFRLAMQDVYDFLYDVNLLLVGRGLERLDDMLRPANLTGTLSDMLTSSLAKHSRTLAVNTFHNGHPDLLIKGQHANNAAKAADSGVEIKSTTKKGGAVDTHGGRNQWMCVFVYDVDRESEPAVNHAPLKFTEVYLGQVKVEDFRKNNRGALGTRTSTLHAQGIKRLRQSWVYLDLPPVVPRVAKPKAAKRGKAAAATLKYALSRSIPMLS